MVDYDAWFQTVWDVLQSDDRACLSMIAATTGAGLPVHLVDGDVSVEDALAYARTLYELGHVVEARDILRATLAAQLEPAAQVGVIPSDGVALVH